jgi:hypothetical protein
LAAEHDEGRKNEQKRQPRPENQRSKHPPSASHIRKLHTISYLNALRLQLYRHGHG